MNFINFQAPMVINIEIKEEDLALHNIFNCAFCNETFGSKKDLKEHKNQAHQQNIKATKKAKLTSQPNFNYVPHTPKFKCEFCFKGFDQSHRLKQHQISHREPVYNCDQVNYGIKDCVK